MSPGRPRKGKELVDRLAQVHAAQTRQVTTVFGVDHGGGRHFLGRMAELTGELVHVGETSLPLALDLTHDRAALSRLLADFGQACEELADIGDVVIFVRRSIGKGEQWLLGDAQDSIRWPIDRHGKRLTVSEGLGRATQRRHRKGLEEDVGRAIVRDRIQYGAKEVTPGLGAEIERDDGAIRSDCHDEDLKARVGLEKTTRRAKEVIAQGRPKISFVANRQKNNSPRIGTDRDLGGLAVDRGIGQRSDARYQGKARGLPSEAMTLAEALEEMERVDDEIRNGGP